MIVTDLKYYLENRLLPKLDLMIKRCEQNQPKKDALLIVEGGEGEGKTNTSIALAYYFKSKTKRDIHMFFKLQNLIEFAKSHEKKIIIWDEPAIDSLSTDWYKKANKDLMRLLMTARKKRHIFIFNLTRFYKFSEYIVVDRSICLIHMYSRREIETGRFAYIKRGSLEFLYNSYRFGKKRRYRDLCTIRGGFPEVLEKHFHKMGIYVEGKIATSLEEYDKFKDEAILSIGVGSKKKDKYVAKFVLLCELLTKKYKVQQKEIAEYLTSYDEPLSKQNISKMLVSLHEETTSKEQL